MIRSAGILMPITSLPSQYGVGTLGKDARAFVDFLVEAGQSYWQILPVGPTGYGNSPYAPVSSFAGNPYLIDLEELLEQRYLDEEDLEPLQEVEDTDHVDYGMLYNIKMPILMKAADRMPRVMPEDYFSFLKENASWLKSYAVFMAIKEEQHGKAWMEWPDALRRKDREALLEIIPRLHEKISRYERIQYFFYKQMTALKKYANDRGVRIIGDLPFYASLDSVDVWGSPEQFQLNQDHTISVCAGMPGQSWGNPLYDWNKMKQDGYAWWVERAWAQYRYCDVLRLDHFQGFLKYYAVPTNGGEGSWQSGPHLEPIRKLQEKYGKCEMIAEDLGELTPELIAMVKESGFPGMKILQYAFDQNDPGSCYMPFCYETNAVVYTGTHDNDTMMGWVKHEPQRVKRAAAFLDHSTKNIDLAVMKCGYASVCDLAMVQAQDLLRLGSEARTNDPSGSPDNWCWRCEKDAFTAEMAEELAENMKLYCRYNWTAEAKKVELAEKGL